MNPVVHWFLVVVAIALVAAVALAAVDLILARRRAEKELAAKLAAMARRQAYIARHSEDGDTLRMEIPVALRAAIGGVE
jgi:hypothetical protein